MEYNLSDNVDLRFELYTDPASAPDEILNILFPSSSNTVFSGGFSYKMKNISIDFGAERKVDPSTENMPETHQMDVFEFSLGFGYSL